MRFSFDRQVVSDWPRPTRLPLTSSCDLPLLFIYFQVNTGVSYFLDYVEDNIYIMVVLSALLVSIRNPNPMYLQLLNKETVLLTLQYITHAVTNVTLKCEIQTIRTAYIRRYHGKKSLWTIVVVERKKCNMFANLILYIYIIS